MRRPVFLASDSIEQCCCLFAERNKMQTAILCSFGRQIPSAAFTAQFRPIQPDHLAAPLTGQDHQPKCWTIETRKLEARFPSAGQFFGCEVPIAGLQWRRSVHAWDRRMLELISAHRPFEHLAQSRMHRPGDRRSVFQASIDRSEV